MKEEFYVQMNLGKTAKNEPILKMGKVGYHFKAPRKNKPPCSYENMTQFDSEQ